MWAALVVRKVLIVVSAVFAPLAFAGSLADITVGWTRTLDRDHGRPDRLQADPGHHLRVGWGILDNGVGQAGSGTTQAVTQTATGLLILTLAGFAPWLALKLVHFSDDQFHHLHVLAGTTTGGARSRPRRRRRRSPPGKPPLPAFGATGLRQGRGRSRRRNRPLCAAPATNPADRATSDKP